MKRKIISLFLALATLVASVALLSSCGDNPGGGGGGGGGGGDGGTTYAWEGKATESTLKFKMTKNTNNDELSSGCERYLSGEASLGQAIDLKVKTRNNKCKTETKLTVVYDYYETGNAYKWGAVVNEIDNERLTKKAADMYCNFVYDMAGAMLKGNFANVKDTTSAGTNYFVFNQKGYDASKDDKGYMYEYMESLTLSGTKMYLVSSDYFVDVIRAFFVVPVNVKLMTANFVTAMETYGLSNFKYLDGEYVKDGAYTSTDLDNDGTNGSIDDFFQLLKDGNWNYSILGTFAETAAKVDSKTSAYSVETGSDSVVGFALSSTSGLSASGMLYTAGIEILKREQDEGGSRSYTYTPANETELPAYCATLKTLFDCNGVISVKGDGSLINIREAFAKNRVLFGGVVCVGSLEDSVYQSMMGESGEGFAVAPPPKYYDEKDYLTQVHNIGRIGAISITTTKFSQCTCFLNYMSTNSSAIMEEYYNNVLVAQCLDVFGNVEMLQMIRGCISWATDKAFEDILGLWGADSGTEGVKLWHKVIMSGETYEPYCIGSEMQNVYNSNYDAKAQYVMTMLDDFESKCK